MATQPASCDWKNAAPDGTPPREVALMSIWKSSRERHPVAEIRSGWVFTTSKLEFLRIRGGHAFRI